MTVQGNRRGMVRAAVSRKRALRRVVLATIVALVATGGSYAGGLTAADAYSVNTGVWSSGATPSVTLPSGVVVSLAMTGLTADGGSANTIATRSGTAAMFTPNLATTTPMKTINTDTAGCTFQTQICANKGTLTVNFSQPVTNPVLHFTGFGGRYQSGSAGATSLFSAVPVLTGSSPAGATLGAASTGSTNLTVTGGATVNRSNGRASTTCSGGLTQDATATAGCGSVPVIGTVTSVTFRMDMNIVLITGSPGSAVIDANHVDAWDLGVSVDEDFGDAPTTYNAGVATSNVVGDLKLGSTIDADNTNVAKAGVVRNVATAIGDCGCNALVEAAHASAIVPTAKVTVPGEPTVVVPGLPFTGAMGVVWAVRGGFALLLSGGFLLLLARRRRDEGDATGAHRAL